MKFNKLVVALIGAFSFLSASFAQEAELKKGDFLLNALYSMGHFDGDGGSGSMFQSGIGANAEFTILDNMIHGKGAIAVGGEFGFGFGSKDYSASGVDCKLKAKRIHLATRGTMHYSFVPALDTYAGFRAGIADWDSYTPEIEGKEFDKVKDNSFIYEFVCGVRYLVSNNFGLNAEVTPAGRYSFLSLGVSFKF